jgi:hypothetical protein
MIGQVDGEILWRVAVVQVAAVLVVSFLLGLILPDGFFDVLGWLVGPAAWMGCAWLTARVVGLPPEPVLVRAALAGIPSVLFVLLGAHWLGALVAIVVFALWCSQLPRPLAGSAR